MNNSKNVKQPVKQPNNQSVKQPNTKKSQLNPRQDMIMGLMFGSALGDMLGLQYEGKTADEDVEKNDYNHHQRKNPY